MVGGLSNNLSKFGLAVGGLSKILFVFGLSKSWFGNRISLGTAYRKQIQIYIIFFQ